jgi:solute carrier family 25 (mitochondrial phosphate transporter), member 23/24/25/41
MSNKDNNTSSNLIQREPIMIPQNDNRLAEAIKQLLCGGIAGSAAKTLTAPFSRLTILFQVHSMVTRKPDRPKFAMSFVGGFKKIVERGGIFSLWRGNGTSVLHRFPYSAINFFVYENMLEILRANQERERNETGSQLARRMSRVMETKPPENGNTTIGAKFLAGATAGSIACIACYPLDLVRTRLTTQLEGQEHYKGIRDAFRKIAKTEGLAGFYSGIGPTLLVAVPNFAISYAVYGTLKEHVLDDELFYNMRQVDAESGETKLGLFLTLYCGACSGAFSTLITFPADTIRRRMQIQNLHIPVGERRTARQQAVAMVEKEGILSMYRGLTPELLKVIPMVGTMFVVYEWTKENINF